MSSTIWYITKYMSCPKGGSVGHRGFMLMKEIVASGHHCVMITSDSNHLTTPPPFVGKYLIQNLQGVKIIWLKTFKYTIAKSLRRIISWLDFEWKLFWLSKNKIEKPDVIIVSSLSLFTILNGFLLKKKYRCKLIFEIRDIWPLTIVEEGGFHPWNPFVVLLSVIEKFGYKYADSIVGTMPNLKDHVEEVVGSSRDVHCIPMGFTDEQSLTATNLPGTYVDENFPSNKFIVGHVGTIGITNALDIVFKCAEHLEDFKDIQFTLVGNGSLKEEYIAKYGYLDNVKFAPAVDKKEVAAVLSHCNLLFFSVFDSKVWKYGQSLNKIIDYMLSGKPIIGSYSGFQTMINEAECGEFISADDVVSLREAILKYYKMQHEEREEIGLKGRQWILDNRNYRKLAQDYLEIILD